MRLQIESTDKIVAIDGVPTRLWNGWTESGRIVEVFVHRIGTADPEAKAELASELTEQAMPREMIGN